MLLRLSRFKSIRYATDKKLVKLTNILLLPVSKLFSNLIDNRVENFTRVDVGCDTHLDFGEKFLKFTDYLHA